MKTREVEEIHIKGRPGEPEGEMFARASLSPLMKAAATIQEYTISNTEYEISDLIVVLDNQVSKTLHGKNLEAAQRILAGQAYTLDAIFNKLAIEAASNVSRSYGGVELYLKLAFKAQSQSRATLLALNEIRNPRLANVVNQANISAGHQQVNNYAESRQEREIAPNELLEANHERVDFGAQAAAGKENPTVETVGAVNRPKKRGRKKQVIT